MLTFIQGGERTPEVMYTSHMFSKILFRIYTSKLWRSALFAFEDDPLDPDRPNEDNWMPCPPLSVLAFAATLTINALRCCVAGGNQSQVPMDEPSHRQIYSEVLEHIKRDWNSPELGQRIQAQIEKALNSIQ